MAEYIEREATIELLRSLGSRDYRREKGTIQEAIKMVSFPEYTPSADVAPVRHGRWHKLAETKLTKTVECTHCHYTVRYNKANGVPFDKAPFCLSCGAKMDGGNDG